MSRSNTKKGLTIVTWRPGGRPVRQVERFVARPPTEARADELARTVLADIRARGDQALLEYVARFDGARLTAAQLRVTEKERAAARAAVDACFRRAARAAHRRITAFARAGLPKAWRMKTPGGGWVGERYVPLDRVGAYIPGGSAPLASTALMTVTLARVAGVAEIAACTPADAAGRVNPYLLYALELAGVTEIYKAGGIQAIGALAYGTRTIAKVQKIVGPGGPYVTAAKRAVYGEVALDMVAGPSEIAILADDSADPRFVAADLLSQAEHGSGSEKALLVTDCPALAEEVREELLRQAGHLSRRALIERVFAGGVLLVVVETLEDGMALCNAFAPEHFELMVRQAGMWAGRVRAAGAVFMGPWTPESAGDFVAGPSHVLPTGGTARMFSGLTVGDFMRRTSQVAFTKKDLVATRAAIEAFGRVEGLDAHARAASIRFDS